MSVIGPRPGLWNQDILTAERDKYNANDVKPGLTGWAQINGRDELEIPEKAKLDGEYVSKMGLMMDIKCFLGSVGVFAHDDSVVEGGTGEMKKVGRHYTEGKSAEERIGHIGFGETVEVDTETKKRVLITGAGSYIGETFKAYAEEYYPTLEIDAVDMLDPAWREKDFSEYDIIYHVAGIAHVTGSPMAEVLHENLNEIEASDIHERLGLEKEKYILLSAHREENIDTEKNFLSLFNAINKMAEKYDMPILYSCHPRSKKRIESTGFKLDPRVIQHEPLGFHDYNCLQMNAFAVVSDSGTLPEESSFFTSVGHPFPAVCIRTSTERPEALDK